MANISSPSSIVLTWSFHRLHKAEHFWSSPVCPSCQVKHQAIKLQSPTAGTVHPCSCSCIQSSSWNSLHTSTGLRHCTRHALTAMKSAKVRDNKPIYRIRWCRGLLLPLNNMHGKVLQGAKAGNTRSDSCSWTHLLSVHRGCLNALISSCRALALSG